MDKRLVRSLLAALVLGFAALAASPVRAQSPLTPTQIVIGAPAAPDLGGVTTVQAVLADLQGHPISKETVYFTTQAKFMNDTSTVVLAQGVTNASGQAVVHFTYDFSGGIALTAEFRGDAEYSPCKVSVQIGTNGTQQVYADHVGVDLPGFNVPPVGPPVASVTSRLPGIDGFIQSLWPAMNGWPVAAVLFLVWSMYFFAVTFVLRLAAAGGEPGEASDTDARRPA